MTNSNRSDISAGDMIRALARHTKKALLIFCLVVSATVAWIVFSPKEYESFARIYVGVGHENNTLDPSATTGQTVNIQQTLESEINSMLQIIESRDTAKLVLDDVGVDSILANDLIEESKGEGKSKTSFASKLKGWISNLKNNVIPLRFSESREELAVRTLQKRSTFWAPKKSSVIEISYKAGHPGLAQQIANSWTEAFVEEHLRVSRIGGSLYFFKQQTREIEGRLSTIDTELKEAKSSAGLVSVDVKREQLELQSNAIRSRAFINQAALESAQATVKKLSSVVNSLPERVETDQKTAQSHQGWNDLQVMFFELQIQEQKLKAKLADGNPHLIAVELQRKRVEKILATQDQSSIETVSGPNTIYQFFQQTLLNEEALVVSLIAEKKSLETQQTENLIELVSLNENAVLIADLERQRLSLDKAYQDSAARTEQARTLQAMEASNISSVGKLQHASYDSIPAGLGRLKTLLLGIFLGAMSAAGYAAIAEYFSRSFVTPSQVEHSLDLPVLVSIPQHRRQLRRAGY